MSIGNRIRAICERQGVLVTHLAEALPDQNARRRFWRLLEDGGTEDPRSSTLGEIADVLGVSVDELMGRKPPKRSRLPATGTEGN